MIRHIALFRWNDGTSDATKAEVAAGMAELGREVPAIRAFAFGQDLGFNDRNFDVGLVVDVDDRSALQAYFDHPVMSRVSALIRSATLPELTARIQFEV